MDQTLTALIHGPSGAGKSWLAATCPKPMLVLDAEGRARYAPSGRKIYWNPATEPVPVYDGTWDTCIVAVADYQTVAIVYQVLRSGLHPFVSVVMDSLMEVQRRCIDAMVPGTKSLDWDDYGVLLREIEKKVREYRDLVLIPSNNVRVALFITGSHSETYKPLLAGGIREQLPYYIDLVGYLQKIPQPDGGFARFLLVDDQPPYTAKDGTDRLKTHFGPYIHLPEDGTQFNGGHAPAPATTEGAV